MAKSIPAIITPEVLQWARLLDLISVDEIFYQVKSDTRKDRILGKWY